MKKLILVATVLSVTSLSGGLSAQANETYSTNSVKVDLTGWEAPEAKPPTDPRPPTGHEVISVPPASEDAPPQATGKLPQTGEQQPKRLMVLGCHIVIIATLALIYIRKTTKQIKGES